eukprot:TRINITY_DN11612_c0_g2_i1.p1 TRINITY_DN11612_c0_g2~~TRINITY_DN11612_c0_g2_i1.p1  ORF type:complete len:841 (-),score=252.42 TRINITY_DN11612_c0_g2_i1:46-2568(-)
MDPKPVPGADGATSSGDLSSRYSNGPTLLDGHALRRHSRLEEERLKALAAGMNDVVTVDGASRRGSLASQGDGEQRAAKLLETRFAALEAELTKLVKNQAHYSDEVSALWQLAEGFPTSQVEKLLGRCDELQRRVEAGDAAFARREDAGRLAARLDGADEMQGQLERMLRTLQEEVFMLRDSSGGGGRGVSDGIVAELEAALKEQSSRLDRVNDSLSAGISDVSDVLAKAATTEQLNNLVQGLGSSIIELSGKVDELACASLQAHMMLDTVRSSEEGRRPDSHRLQQECASRLGSVESLVASAQEELRERCGRLDDTLRDVKKSFEVKEAAMLETLAEATDRRLEQFAGALVDTSRMEKLRADMQRQLEKLAEGCKEQVASAMSELRKDVSSAKEDAPLWTPLERFDELRCDLEADFARLEAMIVQKSKVKDVVKELLDEKDEWIEGQLKQESRRLIEDVSKLVEEKVTSSVDRCWRQTNEEVLKLQEALDGCAKRFEESQRSVGALRESSSQLERQLAEALRLGQKASLAVEAHCKTAREQEKALEMLSDRVDKMLERSPTAEAHPALGPAQILAALSGSALPEGHQLEAKARGSGGGGGGGGDEGRLRELVKTEVARQLHSSPVVAAAAPQGPTKVAAVLSPHQSSRFQAVGPLHTPMVNPREVSPERPQEPVVCMQTSPIPGARVLVEYDTEDRRVFGRRSPRPVRSPSPTAPSHVLEAEPVFRLHSSPAMPSTPPRLHTPGRRTQVAATPPMPLHTPVLAPQGMALAGSLQLPIPPAPHHFAFQPQQKPQQQPALHVAVAPAQAAAGVPQQRAMTPPPRAVLAASPRFVHVVLPPP